MPRRWSLVPRSALALVLAILAIPVVNLAGGWFSEHVLGLAPGGTGRLVADLCWVFMAGLIGTWLAVKAAAVGKTVHAWIVFVLYLAADLHAVVTIGGDFPRWFAVGILGALPLQVWLGWWLAWGRKRPA